MSTDTFTRTLAVGIDADELRRASPESRSVQASLSSDTPIQRFGEVEILSHADGAIDLSRAEGGLPLLIGHDDSGIPLGRIDALRVAGGRLRGTLTFGSSQHAQEALQAVRDGVLRSTSVRYRPLAVEPVFEDGRKVGVRITRWQLIEASLVAVPADSTVGVGRSFSEGTMENENADTNTLELERLEVVDQLCRTLQLDGGFRRELVGAVGKSVDELRSMALAEAARVSDASAGPSYLGVEDRDGGPRARRALMAEALTARFAGGEVSDAARPYAAMRLRDMARECLERAGERTTLMTDAQIMQRAMHTTSDFPLILGDSIGRAVAQAYAAAPGGLKRAGRERQAADFRAMSVVRLGEAPSLEPVNESGEFHQGTVGEAAESFHLATFGRIFAISRQALVNDDLSVFDSIRTSFVQASLEREAAALVALLTSGSGAGPTMSDTKALFHTDHGNLAGTPTALGDTSLSVARLAMRLQKGLDGTTPIDAAPRWLVVPAALETAAEKLLTSIQATKTADANPFGGKLELIVDPRLDAISDKAWYLASDRVEALLYAYLAGERGPMVEVQQGFEADGLKVKCRLDFGAGFVDWRGWYRNAGA